MSLQTCTDQEWQYTMWVSFSECPARKHGFNRIQRCLQKHEIEFLIPMQAASLKAAGPNL